MTSNLTTSKLAHARPSDAAEMVAKRPRLTSLRVHAGYGDFVPVLDTHQTPMRESSSAPHRPSCCIVSDPAAKQKRLRACALLGQDRNADRVSMPAPAPLA